MNLDCIIIGGGPAGLTAATYLRRLHRRVIVFDDGCSRARWIPESHNCPGFPLGVSGTELLHRLREQASRYGATVHQKRITMLHELAGGWQVMAGMEKWSAPIVLLATGVVDCLPTLASGDAEESLRKGLLRSCALCDGYEATDLRIAIVGPLARATPNARYLSAFSSRVTIAPLEEANLGLAGNSDIEGLQVLPQLRSLACTDDGWDVTDALGYVHRFDLVYAAMGAPARGELAINAGASVNEEGAVLTNEHMETTRTGLYAIGDLVTDLNKIAVAFGHAAIAASAIHKALPVVPRHS